MFSISYVDLEGFVNFLMEEELSGKSSRQRAKFVKVAQQGLMDFFTKRDDLISNHAKRDEVGNIITTENEQGNTVVEVDNMEEFKKEFELLNKERFEIPTTEDTREYLMVVQNIVLNTERNFKGQEALLYDVYCDIVEQI